MEHLVIVESEYKGIMSFNPKIVAGVVSAYTHAIYKQLGTSDPDHIALYKKLSEYGVEGRDIINGIADESGRKVKKNQTVILARFTQILFNREHFETLDDMLEVMGAMRI